MNNEIIHHPECSQVPHHEAGEIVMCQCGEDILEGLKEEKGKFDFTFEQTEVNKVA